MSLYQSWSSVAPESLKVLSVDVGNTYSGTSLYLVICRKNMEWYCKNMVQLQLKLMAAATNFDNTFVADKMKKKIL